MQCDERGVCQPSDSPQSSKPLLKRHSTATPSTEEEDSPVRGTQDSKQGDTDELNPESSAVTLSATLASITVLSAII